MDGNPRTQTGSEFNPSVVFYANAYGLMQMLSTVGKSMAHQEGLSGCATFQYQGIDEFVESIPFTQTREYVESILRNIEIYKEIDAAAAAQRK